MMNTEHNLRLSTTDIPLHDPSRFQNMEEVYSTLFCGDYISKLGFPFSDAT